MRIYYRYFLLLILLLLSGSPLALSLQAATTAKGPITIGVMLPLHQLDGDGKRMTEYYRGMLMACNQLKTAGYTIHVQAWNVDANTDIEQVLQRESVEKCNVIFGPLYSKQVKPLADYCKSRRIRLVIPFSITGNEVASNPYVFQVYQDGTRLTNAAVNAFLERFSKCHPVFVDCNDSINPKGAFTAALRKQLDIKGVSYNITNLKSPDDAFAKAFSATQPNVVVLNTARSPELNAAFVKLERLEQLYPGRVVRLFGYTEWLMYASYDFAHFCKYDTYIPTTFYYNASATATQTLEKSYRSWFHEPLMQALPRFAITGYDHAQFFIRGILQYGNQFTGNRWQRFYQPLQTPLQFEPVGKGGRQNRAFQLIHYLYNGSIESLAY